MQLFDNPNRPDASSIRFKGNVLFYIDSILSFPILFTYNWLPLYFDVYTSRMPYAGLLFWLSLILNSLLWSFIFYRIIVYIYREK